MTTTRQTNLSSLKAKKRREETAIDEMFCSPLTTRKTHAITLYLLFTHIRDLHLNAMRLGVYEYVAASVATSAIAKETTIVLRRTGAH